MPSVTPINKPGKGRPSRPILPSSNTPAKLKTLWRKCGYNYYKVGKKRGINPAHVYNLIKKGKEPKREDLRRALFLTNKKSKEELAKIRERRKDEKLKVAQEIETYFKEVFGG